MYPTRREADSVHSGTGVFYQAMPAVGADGKNIMKLIPVQMVNGKFVQTQISQPKMDPKPQNAITIKDTCEHGHMGKTAALNFSATQPIIREPVYLVDALPNQVGVTEQCLALSNSLNKYPLQQQTLNLMAKKPLMAILGTNCGKSTRPPVTIKSPALPRGQYLQIPSNAQVQTVPVSELPPGIKKQIFTSSANSSSSVVYVSPVTTVNQCTTPPSSSSPGTLSNTSNMTSHSSGRSRPHLKLIPKVSQRPNSPIKWVIEEEEDRFRGSTLDPLISPSITSEIFRPVAERDVTNKHCEITNEKPISPSSLAKSEKRHENALVVCNGKVFFVAKKCRQPFKLKRGGADPPKAATKSYQVKKTSIPPSQNSLRQDSRIIIPDESDDVIDLCNEDCPYDSSQQESSGCMSTMTDVDEDNVIFVSYIPPKSDSGPTQNVIQKALEKETDQASSMNIHCVKEQKSLTDPTSSVSEILTDSGTLVDHLAVSKVKNVTHVCGAAVVKTNNSNTLNMNTQQSNYNQHLESMKVDPETESSADPSTPDSSIGICSQMEDTFKIEVRRLLLSWEVRRATKEVFFPIVFPLDIETDFACCHSSCSYRPSSTDGTFSPAPKPFHMADDQLRRIFGITATVRICLQRIDEVSTGAVPEAALENKSMSNQSEDDIQKTNRFKEKALFLQDLYDPQQTESDSGLISVKRVNLLTDQEFSGDIITSGLHTDIRPIKCSLFKQTTKAATTLKSKYTSGQSLDKDLLCDVETEPVIGYVEPLDDDLPSADENNIFNSTAHSQIQTCVNPNANRRSMGRARKRTMCPCCIPGALDPAVKSSVRWSWTTEQSSKKGRRRPTKARKHDGKTPRRINCIMAKNKQNCKAYKVPASDSLSATSMDSDELKQIRRLKELLKENEATLEMMRNSSISD
ncbi:uncharacterized protein lrif1 [Scomber scombrus]|uniref:uncharacterized protein lrif1 n=1 Tax=Scomber scombrus TaxID=13677 RepID=UPI002DD804CA|nr:uncharacterized protein lrif1 [Scomber scombrus]